MTAEKDKSLDALFGKPAFANLGERRAAMFRRFAEEIEGKNAAEITARFFKLNKEMSKEEPLTRQEREAVSSAIKESLSEEDRQKYGKLLKMI